MSAHAGPSSPADEEVALTHRARVVAASAAASLSLLPPAAGAADWHLGGMHVHSLDGSYDGVSPLVEMMDEHKRLGYDFVVLTEHDNWIAVEGGPYDTPSFLAVNGEELSGIGTVPGNTKVAHVTGFDTSGIINEPGTWQEEVDAVNAAGGVPCLAHPRWGTSPKGVEGISEDILQIAGVDHIEVHNGHHDTSPSFPPTARPRVASAEQAWWEVLDTGRLLYGNGTDDSHRVQDVGLAWTVMWADDLSVGAIRAAYLAGRFYGSTGPHVLEYSVSDQEMSVTVDATTQGVRNVSAIASMVIQFVGPGNQVLAQSSGPSATYTFAGDEPYVRFIVDTGNYWAWGQPYFPGQSQPWSTTGGNRAPFASAGADQSVDEGTLVTLDGQGSDLDGDPLTFGWAQTAGPAIALADPTQPITTFVAPLVEASTLLRFELTVSDGQLQDTDSADVTVLDLDGPADPALEMLLRLDDGSGTVASDSSGKGNDGTLLNGPAWVSGRLGGALSFDGVNDAVDVPDRMILRPGLGPYTMSAWFQCSTAGETGFIFSKRQTTSPWPMTGIFLQAGKTAAVYRSSIADREEFVSAATFTDGLWHHAALVINAGSATFYVDGVAMPKTVDTGAPNPANTDPVRLGDGNGGNQPFAGQVDDARIYTRALTAAEVLALANPDPQPGSLQFSAATYATGEDQASATLTVTRSGGSAGAVSVDYGASDGTATAGVDYFPASGTLFWADGDAGAKTFNVAILDDADEETDETVLLFLSDPTDGASLGVPASATLTIADDDARGTLQFSSATYAAGEANGSVTITATRTGGSAGAVSVDYATADGTAAAGADYTAASGTLSWADGDAGAKTFAVALLQDSDVEGDETVLLTLVNPSGGALLGAPASATLTIADDDLSSDPTLHVHLKLDEGTGTTASDSSGNGNDGSLLNGPSWSTGRLDGALAFDGVNDAVHVADRMILRPGLGPYTMTAWFKCSTAGETGFILSKRQTTSPWPMTGIFLSSGKAAAVYRSTNSDREEFLSGGTFTDGLWHHVALVIDAGSATFYLDGATVAKTVDSGAPNPTNPDPIRLADGNGGNQPFAGQVDDARIYTRALTAAEVLALANPDPQPGSLQFTAATYGVGEAAGTATATVTRSGGSAGAVSVDYAASNGTATSGADYSPASGTLSWADGDAGSRSFNVAILDDADEEGDETVLLALANLTDGASLGTPGAATLTITDDDSSFDPALEMHLALDDGSGSTASDSSGNGNNGSLLNGPAWGTGRLGGALSFDGVNDAVNVPDQPILRPGLGPYTMTAWFQCSTAGETGFILSKRQTTSPWPMTGIFLQAGKAAAVYRSATNDREDFLSAGTFTDGLWHHAALVIEAGSATFYVDGVSVTKIIDLGAPNPANADPVRLGDGNGGNQPFAGQVDDARIYTRALSAAEVLALASP